MTLNSAGNLGLGVTPSDWNSGYKTFQVNTQASLAASSSAVYLANNFYQDSGGTNRYIATGTAGVAGWEGNIFRWYQAASGSAGAAQTTTNSMTLDASGRLLIGGTTTYDFNGQSNLVVSGTANNSTITIASTTDGYLAFADGTAGTQAYVGRISYYHSLNQMDFWTNGTAKMYLDSAGNLGLGGTPTNYAGYKTFAIIGGASGAVIDASTSGGLTAGGFQVGITPALTTIDAYGPSGGSASSFSFRVGTYGNVVERMRLDSGGRIGFGSQGTSADRFIDAAFAGATLAAGATQFGLVFNPTYPNTATTNLFNIYAGPNITAGATITNVFSLYLEAINAAGSTVANQYGLYQAGSSDKNYFAGNLGLGITSPAAKLHIQGVSATGTVTNISNFSGVSINGNASNVGVTGITFTDGGGGGSAFGLGRGSSFDTFLTFYTNPASTGTTGAMTERARIDASGNFGLGVSPSAWGTGYKAIDLNTFGSVNSTGSNMRVTSNAFFDGSQWTRKIEAEATRYDQTAGEHKWFIGPYGAAAASISFTQAMTLDASGNLLVGSTSSSAIANKNIDVNGTGDAAFVLRVGGTSTAYLYSIASQAILGTVGSVPITFNPNGTERARITSGGTFQTSLDASIYGVTVGRGAGAVATNTVVGASALAANTSGLEQVAVGYDALFTNQTGSYNTAVGLGSLKLNVSGSNNTAVGYLALLPNTASNNTAVGYQAGYNNTTGANNIYMGFTAGYYQQTGSSNTAVGYQAFQGNSTPANNTGVSNSAFGQNALLVNSSGANNTAIGKDSLQANTTATNNTAVGYQAGYSNITGVANCFFGYLAGYSSTGSGNTFVGAGGSGGQNPAGYLSTGSDNNFLGSRAGGVMTTGSKHTILGNYNGNQGGLDIRTATGYVVLSDGDGKPLISTVTTASVALEGATPTTGTGITFPATQNASSNANTLDDYEEGTWTPTLVASGATFTYTASTGGTYVKIGRLVFLSGVVALASKSGGAGSSMGIGGLPFNAGAPDVNGSGQGLSFTAGIGGYTSPAGYDTPSAAVCTPNTATAFPLLTTTLGGASSTVLNIDSLSGTGYMQFSMTYYANT
jgi:hypothetical protein